MDEKKLVKMKNEGMEFIDRIASRVVQNYDDEFMTEARYSWDQLKGAAYMYVKIFGADDYSGFQLAYIALHKACKQNGVDIKAIWNNVVAR